MPLLAMFVLFVIFIFALSASVDVKNERDKVLKRKSKLVIVLKYLRVVIFLGVIWHMVELIYYLFQHTFIAEINTMYHQFDAEGFDVMIVTFSMITMIIFFILIDVSYQITLKVLGDFKFNVSLLKRAKIIQNVFILYILLQFFITAILFESVFFSLEILVIYTLLLTILRTIIRGVLLQHEHDMVI